MVTKYIYLVILNGIIEAFTYEPERYDKIVSIDEWKRAGYAAYLKGKEIILGSLDVRTYKERRADIYPSIVDQLDMIYWDIKNGTHSWIANIDSIKSMYPKE